MGPIFRTESAKQGLDQREIDAIASADIILAGETSGATAAALKRARNACMDADGLSRRESACTALEKVISELSAPIPA